MDYNENNYIESTYLQGKYSKAILTNYDVEEESISQIINLCNQPYSEGSDIIMMPDMHAGKGCTIGTTMTYNNKICPNIVGVDIGCLDKDTEVLTPKGWIKISDYDNEQILVYNADTDEAFFELPNAYIKNPCSEFWHFSNTKNLDQMLSDEHHMLIYQGYKTRGFKKKDYSAVDFVNRISKLSKADNYTAKTTFSIKNEGLKYLDNDIRIFIMISADARLKSQKNGTTHVELHFSKERKIERAKTLLTEAEISFRESVYVNNTTCISFTTDKFKTKDLSQFYLASKEQLNIVCEEVFFWDGTIDILRGHKSFSSTNKINADVIQFAFSATGIRSSIHAYQNINKPNWNTTYVVIPTKNEYVAYRSDMITRCSSKDGYKYCFNTNTGAFVARRNDCIFVTGNCGITVAEFSLSNRDDLDLALCDEIINERIPAGFNIHEHPVAFYKNYSNSVRCYDYLKDIPRIKRSIGTLGGGNHYIEISRSEETGRYIFIVHSGSRNFGKQIAECYQRLAEKVCEDNIPRDLKYLTGEHLENYIHDTVEAQKYAELNRNAMIHLFFEGLTKAGYMLNPFDTWQSIHNYVDTEHKIIRKGAISAYKGQKCIIPLNMRDGSLICIGKGNPAWNCSAPHGAGRKMSRAKAKENIDYDVFKESMNGIYTSSVCRSTLDESPQAYKDASEIERLIVPTVEIVEHLKPLYNFKAH